jgi:capsule polysaccharide export protein KpsE/RkpR
LSRRIDDTILAHLEAGEPTADEVSQHVLTQNDDLIREYGHELAKAQVRSIVSDRMKKTLATKKGKSLQLRLAIRFGTLEPESALTFRDNAGTVRYVATARATAEHHQRYIALLNEQIQADTARLKAAEWFYAWLEPTFQKHPGITTADAIALLEPAGQAA